MPSNGWYEYYVVDPTTRARCLALAAYKPCDARPEHVVHECALLRARIAHSHGRLPVEWLDELLREQLGTRYALLPPGFSLAAFLFLVLRAEEDAPVIVEPGEDERFVARPAEEPWRLAVAAAMAAQGCRPYRHVDPILDRVLFYVATGRYLRPWKRFARTSSVPEWLQSLTQRTRRNELGLTAGPVDAPRPVSLAARFFIHRDPLDPFGITRLSFKLVEPVRISGRPDPDPIPAGSGD